MLAYNLTPQIELTWLQFTAWIAYGHAQGLVFTSLWVRIHFLLFSLPYTICNIQQILNGAFLHVIGHECGHSAFSPSRFLNQTVGFIVHSLLLTPYHSWRLTHHPHHLYTNHLLKDTTWVPPPTLSGYCLARGVDLEMVDKVPDDSPVYNLGTLLAVQGVGWTTYLLTDVTAGAWNWGLGRKDGKKDAYGWLRKSHIHTSSTLFQPSEAWLVILSDIGLLLTLSILFSISNKIGFQHLVLLCLQPYIHLNHWVIAITCPQHTHPSLPKYDSDNWTWLRGALGTVDLDFGWKGRWAFHHVASAHVEHHVFP